MLNDCLNKDLEVNLHLRVILVVWVGFLQVYFHNRSYYGGFPDKYEMSAAMAQMYVMIPNTMERTESHRAWRDAAFAP